MVGPINEGPWDLAVRGGEPESEGTELKGEAELNGSKGICAAESIGEDVWECFQY